MDLTVIIDVIFNIIKGISAQAYAVASQIYPNNPALVLLIAAGVTVYLLHDKMNSVVMIAIAAIFLYMILKGGAV